MEVLKGGPRRIKLGVNVDHVATLRQARGTRYPDPVFAAALAEQAGADQITIHLREDRRHIQERDLRIMRETVQTRLNLEMGATEEMTGIAVSVGPDVVTLVPERREEKTTEAGLDVARLEDALRPVCDRLCDMGIGVSMFIDPEPSQIEASKRLGAHAVEFHTGEFAEACAELEAGQQLARLAAAAKMASGMELYVAAGHGLDYVNTRAICGIPEIEELNIGHAIVARAVFVGFEQAVADMITLMRESAA